MNNRNQPCQCGSGKKFKKCCMESPAAAAERCRHYRRPWLPAPRPDPETPEATPQQQDRVRHPSHTLALAALMIAALPHR